MKNTLIILLASAFGCGVLASGFGKNKVQYQYMDWNILKSGHYHLYYHQDAGELPETAYAWLDDIYRDLSDRFGFVHERPVPVVLYGSPALFEQTNIITEILPEEVGGFTELFKNRVAVPFNGSMSELRHVLHHEMAHAFVFGAVYGGSVFRAASAQVPLWFNEGLAEILSSGWNREADMYMLDRVLNSTVPPPGPMMNSGFIAYKGGQSFLYYLYSVNGDSLFNEMLTRFRKTRSAESAIEHVYGKTLEDLGREWIAELRRIYWPEIGRRMEPSQHAAAVTVSAKDRSRFNLRPRVSPDGRRIAFYSDRRDYARIIIADTAGNTLRVIRQHTLGGSIESFQPMSGALAWSPNGGELAFIAKKGGRNDVRIVNSSTGKLRETVELPQLAAITGLDWSRDGRNLALTGIANGRTNLYMYDLTTRELTTLDNSPSSKAFPRFSPNGESIIYTITDTAGLNGRGQTLIPARPASNLAIFNIAGNGSELLTDNTWNDRQAAFSPDGKSFVFVSDRNGVDNLYIADVDAPDDPRPLTDYAGGAGNPDWAADGSAIVYDNFLNQAWNVWYMSKPEEKTLEDEALALTRWAIHEESGGVIPFFQKRGANANSAAADTVKINAAGTDTAKTDAARAFPTILTASGEIILTAFAYPPPPAAEIDAAATADTAAADSAKINAAGTDAAEADTAGTTAPQPSPYRLRFTPDLVIFGLGVSTYSGVAGQALAMFSDILGDHRITLAGDAQADFRDYAQIYAAYDYLKLRVNLTVGGFYYKYYSYDGLFNRYLHDTETGGFVGAAYPFSTFSRVDGQLFGRYMKRAPVTGDDQTVMENNALIGIFGYTFDNILWGITGPLAGLRARAQLHAAPPLPFAGEAYLSADADVRHYSHLFRRFVWANRLAFGATTGLNGNRAARRFFLGGNDNWLNYGVNIKNYDENLSYSYYSSIISPLRGWDYFDITGDRALLMNSEFRFPFIREVSTVWPLPLTIRYINGAFFIDAGYAWFDDDGKNPVVPPKIAAGYGFGMRANLGIFVLRYDRGWPTDFKGGAGGPINYFSLGAEF